MFLMANEAGFQRGHFDKESAIRRSGGLTPTEGPGPGWAPRAAFPVQPCGLAQSASPLTAIWTEQERLIKSNFSLPFFMQHTV